MQPLARRQRWLSALLPHAARSRHRANACFPSQGDAYIAVSGAEPGSDPVASAEQLARLALAIVAAVDAHPYVHRERLQVRVGLHAGPVVAGVVGARKPKWTLLGDTMNTGTCLVDARK